jgi:hypothetical protein
MPRLGTPTVDLETGQLTPVWQRFLQSLWFKTGNSFSSLPGSYYLQQVSAGVIGIYNSLTNAFAGTITASNPQPPQVIVLTSNPFTYAALVPGTLVVFGGELALQRGASAHFQVGLVGGAVPLLPGDKLEITWFSGDPPSTTWFPSA